MDSLSPQELSRYKDKIQKIGGKDPYKLPSDSFSKDPKLLPSVTYPDIFNYLIMNPSPYTKEDLKAYKGLEAVKQFVAGFVRDISTYVQSNHCLVKAKVYFYQLYTRFI